MPRSGSWNNLTSFTDRLQLVNLSRNLTRFMNRQQFANSLTRMFPVIIISLLLANSACGQGTNDSTSAYQDLSHFSKAFGHEKLFRLYLPDNYKNGTDRYPVIYYFHGWSERYFKSLGGVDFEKLRDLVNKYQVILVMWDGNIKETDPRPYNVGFHKDVKDE